MQRNLSENSWQQISEIFHTVVELAPAERERILAAVENGKQRAEVERLLAADDAERDFLDASPIENIQNKKDFSEPPERIGNYRIVREIGRGGMGAVYLAEREDLKKQVALKIIKRGMDTDEITRRFQTERLILANLEHQNIARLFDGGTTSDGLPFLAMEYIAGEDLLTFCETNNPDLTKRLELFRKICAAVSYAHQNLVVHRDLKPSNILVNEKGEPKLLDFGISKLITEVEAGDKGTVTSLGMLTPNYASPEQFRGETVTTATDIYSLGVILFELLTGSLPHAIKNKRFDEAARIVIETEPSRPSSTLNPKSKIKAKKSETDFSKTENRNTNRKSLKGDLDNIVLKAMRKDTRRRYATVEQFSEDIRRHLVGLPVSARPDVFSYRASKFVQRNRLAVVSAAFVVLALLGGVAGTTWQAIRAEQERERAENQRLIAEQRFVDVRRLANNIVFKYHDEIKNLAGATKVREMLVGDALIYLDNLAQTETSDVSLQIELAQAYIKIGDVQGELFAANLGDTAGAFESYKKSLRICDELRQTSPNEPKVLSVYGEALLQIGKINIRRVEFQTAIENLENARAIRENLSSLEPNEFAHKRALAKIYIGLGDAVARSGEKNSQKSFRRTLAAFQQALQINESLLSLPDTTAEDWREAARAHQRIGHTLQMSWFYDTSSSESLESQMTRTRPQSLFHHGRAIEIFARLSTEAPNNARAARDYADALLMRAEIKARDAQIEAATKDCRTAILSLEKLLAADAENQELRYDAAMAYYQTSNVFQNVKQDNRRGAEMMTKAVETLETLVAANRSNQQSLGDLHAGLGRLRDMTAMLGSEAKADIYLEKLVKYIRVRFPEKKDLAAQFIHHSGRAADDARGYKNAASSRINLRAAKEFLRHAAETNQNAPDLAVTQEIERVGKLIVCRERSLKNLEVEKSYAACQQAMQQK